MPGSLFLGLALAFATRTVTGTVTLVTAAPSGVSSATVSHTQPLNDRHVCGDVVQTRLVDIDARGRLRGALVYVSTSARSRRRLRPVRMTIGQERCQFRPGLVAIPVRSTVQFTSVDATLHNVHLRDADGRTITNQSLVGAGQKTPRIRLKKPGRYEVVCEAGHDWMRATIFVMDHPWFAVTDEHGRFSISGVPKGALEVVVFHPDLGARVAVLKAVDANVDLAF